MTGGSKTREKVRGILLVASALAVSSALSYFLVFAPKFREVKRLQAELIVAEADMGKGLEVWGEIRFRVAFFSTYKEMAAFLDGVPRMKRLLSIRNLEVSEKEGEMETTLELSAFYRSRR